MPTVRQLLEEAVASLRDKGVDSPLLDAELLMCHALGCSRTELVARIDAQISPVAATEFAGYVGRRTKREPLAYITGYREFYGLPFRVTPATLIPRQESEFLVDAAVSLLKDHANPLMADVGVGSGCIGISIAIALPSAQLYGTDISRDALGVARSNAVSLGVGGRTRFVQGDLLGPLAGLAFDIIISNPPYIPSGDMNGLEPEVAEFEPRLALDGGYDGLDLYRRLAESAAGCLEIGGTLAVEMGIDQSSAVQHIFRLNGFSNVRVIQDYSGIERVAIGESV